MLPKNCKKGIRFSPEIKSGMVERISQSNHHWFGREAEEEQNPIEEDKCIVCVCVSSGRERRKKETKFH